MIVSVLTIDALLWFSRVTADCGRPHKKKGGTQHRWSTCAYTLNLCLLHTVSVTFAEWCAWQVLRIALASLSAASQPQLMSCLNVARTSGNVVQNGHHPSVYFFQPRFASEVRSDHVTSAYPTWPTWRAARCMCWNSAASVGGALWIARPAAKRAHHDSFTSMTLADSAVHYLAITLVYQWHRLK